MAVALLGIVGMVAASFFLFTKKTKDEITNEIEDKVDNIIAERMLLKDLKYSEPSFNNVIIRDDNGRRFFDLVSDFTDNKEDDAERIYTLENGKKMTFTFMITNERVGATMYAPSIAYDIGPPPADPNVAASLTFRSLNKDMAVTLAKPQGALWQPGTILMLDSLAFLREMKTTGPDYSKPARALSFVGVVSHIGESRLRPLPLGNFLFRTHPLYPNEVIDNEDKFLRNVPPMGGVAPIVRLRSVRIVMYYLQKDHGKKGSVNLYRSTFDGEKFAPGQLFASDVSTVVFSRKDARDSLIYYVINRSQ